MNNFGDCCKELADAMDTTQRKSFFRVEENGVLYLTIGYVQVDDGRTGWFDQAVLYCPFCGTNIQNKEEIKNKSQA